jgi:hypothetical protein
MEGLIDAVIHVFSIDYHTANTVTTRNRRPSTNDLSVGRNHDDLFQAETNCFDQG